ncbi:MAG: CBASS cGAMP-activated phospholipase [Deltaproteobacteria bacterium]|jgi:patatin-like phospholipase/acyl hydrolase|nr:CBASS cGAMP-activated phospholipase [Deltaproteobacteria bacterium]
MGKVFRILSIDGGGIRGVFPAHILQCISARLNVDIFKHFDMIAGTSTGSIIAAGITCSVSPETIVAMYKEQGETIFKKRWSFIPKKYQSADHSLYDSKEFSNILHDVFGDTTLGEIKIPLLLPATDIGYGGVHVFKSGYSPDFTRDKNVLVKEAVLASCSAPTFFDPKKVDQYLLSDGGLWANNPSLAAVIDAQYRLNIEPSSIRVLSLGTGHSRTSYGVDNNRKWGLLRGWKGPEFINFIMSLQAQSIHNYLQLLLKKNQIMRINFESDLPLPLDDCSAIDDLISRADREFTHKSSDIDSFLKSKGE